MCAFLWGVISNNYYERLETFGPSISQLITENYQDVLTPYMSEMTNLQEVLETIENRVNQGEGESEVQDEQGEQEVQGGESKDNSRQLSLLEVNGDIELRPDVIQRMNERHLNSETYTDDGITLELSYGTIAEYLGVGYFQAVLGNNNGIDIINQIETNITNAIQQDVVEIVKRRINSIRIEGQNTGNDDSGLSQLGNVVTDFFTMFFRSNNANYRNAPGSPEKIQQTLRRAQVIRDRWNTWNTQVTGATHNFVLDVVLYIRTTSYYLWAYFVCMQALELYAVRAFYRLMFRRPRISNQRSIEFFDESDDDESDDDESSRLRLGDTIDTTEQQLERSIESAGLPRMVSRPVRGLKYLLIVALFRGLSEGIRMGLGRSDIMDSMTTITVLQPGARVNRDIQQATTAAPATTAIKRMFEVARNSNEEYQPAILRQSSTPVDLPSLDRQISTDPDNTVNLDQHRTSNGITINIPSIQDGARLEELRQQNREEFAEILQSSQSNPEGELEVEVVQGGGMRKNYKIKGGGEKEIKCLQDKLDKYLKIFSKNVEDLVSLEVQLRGLDAVVEELKKKHKESTKKANIGNENKMGGGYIQKGGSYNEDLKSRIDSAVSKFVTSFISTQKAKSEKASLLVNFLNYYQNFILDLSPEVFNENENLNNMLFHKTLSYLLNLHENSVPIDKHFNPEWKLHVDLYLDEIANIEFDSKFKNLSKQYYEEISEKIADNVTDCDEKISLQQKEQKEHHEQIQQQIQEIKINIDNAQTKSEENEIYSKEKLTQQLQEIKQQLLQQQQNMSNVFPQQMYYPPMQQHTIYGHLMHSSQPYMSHIQPNQVYRPIGAPPGVPQPPSMSNIQTQQSNLPTDITQQATDAAADAATSAETETAETAAETETAETAETAAAEAEIKLEKAKAQAERDRATAEAAAAEAKAKLEKERAEAAAKAAAAAEKEVKNQEEKLQYVQIEIDKIKERREKLEKKREEAAAEAETATAEAEAAIVKANSVKEVAKREATEKIAEAQTAAAQAKQKLEQELKAQEDELKKEQQKSQEIAKQTEEAKQLAKLKTDKAEQELTEAQRKAELAERSTTKSGTSRPRSQEAN